jgi:hypothetical protein
MRMLSLWPPRSCGPGMEGAEARELPAAMAVMSSSAEVFSRAVLKALSAVEGATGETACTAASAI